jgi:hypothetical protein
MRRSRRFGSADEWGPGGVEPAPGPQDGCRRTGLDTPLHPVAETSSSKPSFRVRVRCVDETDRTARQSDHDRLAPRTSGDEASDTAWSQLGLTKATHECWTSLPASLAKPALHTCLRLCRRELNRSGTWGASLCTQLLPGAANLIDTVFVGFGKPSFLLPLQPLSTRAAGVRGPLAAGVFRPLPGSAP